jgi:hypothetical protein
MAWQCPNKDKEMGLVIFMTTETPTEPFVKAGRKLASTKEVVDHNSFNEISDLEGFFVNCLKEVVEAVKPMELYNFNDIESDLLDSSDNDLMPALEERADDQSVKSFESSSDEDSDLLQLLKVDPNNMWDNNSDSEWEDESCDDSLVSNDYKESVNVMNKEEIEERLVDRGATVNVT